MKTALTNYDIYPKVVLSGREAEITIRPLGDHARFQNDRVYTVTLSPMNESTRNEERRDYPSYELRPAKGALVFRHPFGNEGQYMAVIEEKGEKSVRALPAELRLYAAEEDLFALRPWRGDMHVHSFRSDGREAPAIVAANYRKGGFDFFALTDHERYEPSLEMIEAYKSVPIDIKLFTGEEVHPPKNYTHYIHFGGDRSVNGLIRQDPEKYRQEVLRLSKELDIPEGVNREEFASCYWVCTEIHKAGGLAVMVHPHWIHEGAYHTREKMARFMFKSKLFDAFEIIGGQTLAENQPQVSLWQEMRAEGCFLPPLGNSDSHGTVNAEWFQLAKTVVFSETCERESIFEAIKQGRTVALEQYHTQYAGEPQARLYGRHRYVMFALFLLEEYFPLHDELCYEEGRLMKDHICGEPGAAELLGRLQGRCGALMKKCWGT
jgi:predicted metal-dependent phosphoesterase TrpH